MVLKDKIPLFNLEWFQASFEQKAIKLPRKIPILNEKDEPHAEGSKHQDEFLDMFSKPSIRNENVGGLPAALDSFVDAMRNEKVDLMIG
mgnify:CR=1 FL=1